MFESVNFRINPRSHERAAYRNPMAVEGKPPNGPESTLDLLRATVDLQVGAVDEACGIG